MEQDIKTVFERHIGDPVADVMRLRGTPKSASVKQGEAVGLKLVEVAKRHGFSLDYDQSNAPRVLGLRYTEIFASLGGILVGPKDTDKAMDMLAYALLNYTPTASGGIKDHSSFVSTMGDKYNLIDFDYDFPEKLCVLPGSNLLEQCVDKVALNKAVEGGAWIKPHPMTARKHRELFKREYGDRLLPPDYSGVAAVKNAKVIYTSGSSELTLMALLLGKHIIEIGCGDPLGGYMPIWKFLSVYHDKRMVLNKLMSSVASGIFFPHSTEAEMDTYFEIYKKVCQ